MSRYTNKYQDEEGAKLINNKQISRQGQPDVIQTHPSTNGKVFCGDITAASTRETLEECKIYNVINCQGMNTENQHEKNPKFTQLRFPIGNHQWSPFDCKTEEGLMRFLNPFFMFVEKVLEKGENVMIHCLAGAHRAGTASCAWLMQANNQGFPEAQKLAKSIRNCIEPIGDFSDLLKLLEVAKRKYPIEDIRKKQITENDLKNIHSAISGKGQ